MFTGRGSKMTCTEVCKKMIEYYKGDCKRINHFLKVYSFAKTIGEAENITKEQQFLLEISALTHDIGIKISEEKYNSSLGKYQEQEGPAVAEKMLSELGFQQNFIKDVCYLIAHHHTYNNIDNIVYQILIEADFIVNIFEDNLTKKQIVKIQDKIFKTKTGNMILENMYLCE